MVVPLGKLALSSRDSRMVAMRARGRARAMLIYGGAIATEGVAEKNEARLHAPPSPIRRGEGDVVGIVPQSASRDLDDATGGPCAFLAKAALGKFRDAMPPGYQPTPPPPTPKQPRDL